MKLTDTSVRTRLILTLSILSVALLLVGLFGIRALARTQQNVDGIYLGSMSPIQWLNKINAISEDDLLALDNALISGDTEHTDALKRRFAESAAQSEALWRRYQEVDKVGNETQLATSFWKARDEYLQVRARILELLANGQTLVAGSWRNKELQKAFTAQQQPLAALLDLQNQLAEQAYQAATQRYTVAKWTSISAILIALACAVALATLLLRKMLHALDHAVQVSERIAAGELGHDSVSKIKIGTELVGASGQVLSDIVAGVKSVSDIVAEIAAASREQAAGINQVNAAVTQMESVTLRNAKLAEDTTSASQCVAQGAQELMELVAYFNTSASVHGIAAEVQDESPGIPDHWRRVS